MTSVRTGEENSNGPRIAKQRGETRRGGWRRYRNMRKRCLTVTGAGKKPTTVRGADLRWRKLEKGERRERVVCNSRSFKRNWRAIGPHDVNDALGPTATTPKDMGWFCRSRGEELVPSEGTRRYFPMLGCRPPPRAAARLTSPVDHSIVVSLGSCCPRELVDNPLFITRQSSPPFISPLHQSMDLRRKRLLSKPRAHTSLDLPEI
ncbi:hypothetical protein YC2023_066480 [Brassica napus]